MLIKSKPKSDFTIIPNKAINADISLQALGIYIKIRQHASSWRLNIKKLAKDCKIKSLTTFYKYLNELYTSGLLDRVQSRDAGGKYTAGVAYVFTDDIQSLDYELNISSLDIDNLKSIKEIAKEELDKESNTCIEVLDSDMQELKDSTCFLYNDNQEASDHIGNYNNNPSNNNQDLDNESLNNQSIKNLQANNALKAKLCDHLDYKNALVELKPISQKTEVPKFDNVNNIEESNKIKIDSARFEFGSLANSSSASHKKQARRYAMIDLVALFNNCKELIAKKSEVKKAKKRALYKTHEDFIRDLNTDDALAYRDYIAYRKEKKALSNQTIKRIQHKFITLLNNKEDMPKVVDNAIRNGWVDLYPLKKSFISPIKAASSPKENQDAVSEYMQYYKNFDRQAELKKIFDTDKKGGLQ